MMRLASAGTEIPLTQRARYRWDAAKAIDWSVRAVDRLFNASGGRGIFLDNPIQRAWRDVHAMRAHAANNPEKIASVLSRSEFGLPLLDRIFYQRPAAGHVRRTAAKSHVSGLAAGAAK